MRTNGATLSDRSLEMLRKAIFLVFVGVGVLVGLAAGLHGDRGLQIVMAGLGALVGAALGGAAVGLGRRGTTRREIPGLGTTSSDMAANFWRDRGRPPA